MSDSGHIKSIVVLGGGSAGWITAGLIAAKYRQVPGAINVSVVESPDIGIIGVGEGTWPTMVNTLKKMGISESTFIQHCHASYKQASKFQRWVTGEAGDSYYHPFTMPQGFDEINLVPQWQPQADKQSFADAVSIQPQLCDQYRAPKPLDADDYATVENHGYHLDAGKFTQLLTKHCVEQLGVKHIQADVVAVNSKDNGDIESLVTKQCGDVGGDLFIDCSGVTGLLIDKHYAIPFISQKDVLFIDKALAVQVPYQHPDDDIQSATLSTAQEAGWIWDIGLSNRRGVGHVYASKYISDDRAKQQLIDYLGDAAPNPEQLKFKQLDINPGFREVFWHKNCVAVGMSSGFLEPLEASALVMVELAANTIAAHLPAHRNAMDAVAKHYNEIFTFRWQKIIDFLKLHYVLSKRDDSQFWRDNRDPSTIPQSLTDLLNIWQYQSPSNNGYLSPYDLFPAASYQYILYGMGFETEQCHLEQSPAAKDYAQQQLDVVKSRKQKVCSRLPTNRQLLNKINGMQREQQLDQQSDRRFVEVCWSSLPKVVTQHPVFITQNGDRLICAALMGLDTGEQLQQPNWQYQPQHKICVNHLVDLLEPVNLDITLNSGRELLLKGLSVFDQRKLAAKKFADKDQQLIQLLQDSLQHVPSLIALKNSLA